MLTDKVFYFFTFIGLTFGIWSILLCPHLVMLEEKDTKTEPESTINVPKVVTDSPLETMVEAAFYAAVALVNFRMPMLLVMPEHPIPGQPGVPCTLNALLLYPKLMYKILTCAHLVLSSLWMLVSRENYQLVLQMALLCVLQFYTLGEISMVLHYTTEVRNRRPQLNEAAGNGGA